MNKHGGYYGTNKKMLDFSVNLNPLGTPEVIKEKMMSLLDALVNYPEPYGHKAKEAIANWLNLEESASLVKENVLLGNGATELIYLFARCFKPKKVMIIQPTFNEYERAFIQSGSVCTYFQVSEATNFQLDGDALVEAIINEKPNVVVLCNPNNPTAAYIQSPVIESILSTLTTYNGMLFVDESFYEFERRKSALPLLSENVFMIRSLTKYYGIAGLRLGYGIGSIRLIEALEAVKEPWTLNTLATEIVPELTLAKEYQDKTSAWYICEKKWMLAELEDIPFLTVYPSAANFFFCKTAIPSQRLMEELLLEGIYIRTCEDFVGLDQQYIRFALKNHEDNKKLISALQKQGGHNVSKIH